ncbi:MAG: fumarate hydratase C-terminal domain-containing protein [Gammaproteobacteria bacterium]
MLEECRISLPVTEDDVASLQLGAVVYLTGTIYTAREGVYHRVLNEGHPLPAGFSDHSNVNFHCSPAAAKRDGGGFEIGGVTATASFRFSQYLAQWLDLTGTKIVIGKGGMAEEDYRQILAPRGVIYLTTIGYGTGALLGRGIQDVKAVHWLDALGIAQAMWLFKVKDFGPFLVESDLRGQSLFAQQGETINRHLDSLYDGLKEPALHRYGETKNRTDELI